jgi:hypothetical protein
METILEILKRAIAYVAESRHAFTRTHCYA